MPTLIREGDQGHPSNTICCRTLPAGVNEDYLLSDLLVVSIRAKAGDPIALTTFQVPPPLSSPSVTPSP